MNYNTLAIKESIDKVLEKLPPRGFTGTVVNTKEEALSKIIEIIPANSSINNGASKTLEQIGFLYYLKNDNHNWKNLHQEILDESDPTKQGLLRKQLTVCDYYLGSVHALTENGELFFASATGSQLPPLAFNAQNLVLVVGSQKIVKDLSEALKRLEEYIMPLEDNNMKEKYGPDSGTLHAKTLILHREHPMMKRTVNIIIVNEILGF